MSKRRARRQYTADEKLRILEEARQPNTSVAEALRRHQVDAATFYRWERQANDGMRAALEGGRLAVKGEARGASSTTKRTGAQEPYHRRGCRRDP